MTSTVDGKNVEEGIILIQYEMRDVDIIQSIGQKNIMKLLFFQYDTYPHFAKSIHLLIKMAIEKSLITNCTVLSP